MPAATVTDEQILEKLRLGWGILRIKQNLGGSQLRIQKLKASLTEAEETTRINLGADIEERFEETHNKPLLSMGIPIPIPIEEVGTWTGEIDSPIIETPISVGTTTTEFSKTPRGIELYTAYYLLTGKECRGDRETVIAKIRDWCTMEMDG